MKQIKIALLFLFFLICNSFADDQSKFLEWKKDFKIIALKNEISESTFDTAMKHVKYLPNVIKYDRFQPEFYEDTNTYVSKRTSKKKVEKGISFFNQNSVLINAVETKYKIEKELLLSLMGIETNYGTYVGKMDILSSLSTLSYDKRRSQFFTNELLTLLKLIETKKIDYKTLYGSWAGAFGFFQFMPSTIRNHALDFDNDNVIDLKNPNDAFASAGNYLNSMGWKQNSHCFYEVELKSDVPKKYLNASAKKLKNKKKLKDLKRFIINIENLDSISENLKVAIITPDKDIIPSSNNISPAYIVFDNYEIILKWNRSLRFALAVCTLKSKIKNEL